MFSLKYLFAVLVCLSLRQASAVLQDSSFEVVDIKPCSSIEKTVSRSDSITLSLIANFSLCNSNDTSYYPLRVSTWSNEANDNPLVFVTRQGKAVNSWTLPFKPPDFFINFNSVNRTLCDTNKTDGDNVLAYLDVLTSSTDSISFHVLFEPVTNFIFRERTQYQIVVGASTPQVHMFTFPNGIETVTVQAEANNRRCAILSVQNISCPINDLLEEIKSRGHYQTMSTDGFLTVSRNLFTGDSFLIILITTNFSECHSSNYVPQIPLTINGTVLGFEQTITVTVRPLQAAPVLPILLPLIIFGIFYIVTIICMYFEGFLKCLWSPFCKWKLLKTDHVVQEEESETQSLSGGINPGDHSYGTTSTSSPDHPRTSNENTLQLSILEAAERDLKLPQFSKSGYNNLQSQYAVYSWNTVTVGIFYALPAFQLVLSQQLLANNSGEEDLCYYNFKCSHPVGVFNSFNNVWSNVGYILLGLLFIIVTYVRKRRFTALRNSNKRYYDEYGIPQFYGIYYAMGLALILEGFMSALYHICPTNANFQFDTAFMFIIAGLVLTKIFQNRHPTIHANAFIAFFSFAVVIFFTLLGIYYDNRNPVAVRCTLLTVILIMVAGFLGSFYYFHRWKLSKEVFIKMFNSWRVCGMKPMHPVRFLKLLGALIINIIIAVVAIFGHSFLDFATTILTFFLVNVVIFLSAYVITKWYYREPWTLFPMCLPLVICILWATSLYYFLNSVTNWQLTPAESRALNRPCVLMEFYDSHDVWHFLSACALFFSFLFIMTLDDGVTDKKRETIQVF